MMESSLMVREMRGSTHTGYSLSSASSASSRHVKWSNHDESYEIDPDLERDVTLYNMEKTHTRTTRRIKSEPDEPFDYNYMASIPASATRSPIASRKVVDRRSPSPTIDPRSPSPSTNVLTLPPKTMEVRTPSPKDKIEEHAGCKYHSHHLDYVYTPPPVKGPCVGCGQYIIGPLVTALDGMWHPECFTCVNCDVILKAHNYVIEDGKQYCTNCHCKLFGPPCSVCHKPTGENRLTVMNRLWHPQCFACVNCSKKLSLDNYVERLGSPYCKECYHKMFSPKCCECEKPITEKAINALGKYWHTYCFKCCLCQNTLSSTNFYDKNGKPYCENCFHKSFSPKCAGCKLPITDNNKIVAMGKSWHPKCFTCIECAKPLNADDFKEHMGNPYCDYDYHRLFSPKCAACDTPIVDNNKVQAMGKPWHPSCFTCAQCAKQLTPPNFIEKNGKPYCTEDYHRLFSPKCAGCDTPIADGNKVQAMGKPWHPKCFQCTQCKIPLAPNNFLEKNGKPYCEDDYHRLFSPKCAACHLPITDGNYVTALGKVFHPHCFTCTQCVKPLSPNNFYEKNGKPYCEDDYHKLFSSKCAGCKLPITDDNFINALGKKWHPQCFKCTTCAKPLGPNNFYEKNGLPYCEDDFHRLFSPKCAGCKLPITDDNYITALGKNWHPQCFNCDKCHKQLDPYNFFEKGGKPYCEDDYHKLFSTPCAGCERPIKDDNKTIAMGKQWHPPCFNCDKCHRQLSPNNFLERGGKPYCEDCFHKVFSPRCAGCDLPITGPKVVAMGKNWHPQCFNCDKCHKQLNPSNFLENGGKPYCEDDYHKLFSPKCAACQLPIKDKNPIIANGRKYHPECFKCHQCAVRLNPNDFKEKDGHPYCTPHYYQLFAPKCYACKQPILDKVVTALGKPWHQQCFSCVQCHKPLHQDGFREKDGLSYCDNCYHKLFSPKCAACNSPIQDKCLTALGKTWHPEHFTCQHCNKQMGEDPEGYHEKNDKAYCRDCYFELFAPKCRGCHKAIVDKICVTALDSHWHPDCFVCRDCHCPLKNGNYFEFEGEPYCEEHYRCKMCPDCIKLRRAQNKYFGQPTAAGSNSPIKLGA